MVAFDDPRLKKLRDPAFLLEVAAETHRFALELKAEGKLPEIFFTREIYEPGTEPKTLASGEKYYEISHYSDGFGSSLFVKDGEMLYLSSDHELSPLGSLAGEDRDLYLAPLLKGLPSKWDFVVDMLQAEKRFAHNPPAGIFWFRDGQWHITDEHEKISASGPADKLFEYKDSAGYVSDVELEFLFVHSGKEEVDRELLMETYFKDWMRVA